METGDNKPTPTQKQANKIFSYKPKGEQLTFLESLIAEKGSMTTALQHCVDQAMNPPSKKDDDVNRIEFEREIKSNQKLINQYIEREKQFRDECTNLEYQISSLKSQISNLKSQPDPIRKERTGIGML